jgi:holo-[acyl-carrier protein] synthase
MLDLWGTSDGENGSGESVVNVGEQLRVGTDVESITDVAASLEHFGARYANRLYTDTEITTCGGINAAAAPRLAARFAAKEAVIKLLDPTDLIPGWRSIEIRNAPNGAPSVHLSGAAAELAKQRGIGSIAISMSHGAGIGLATVVASVIAQPSDAAVEPAKVDQVDYAETTGLTTPRDPAPAIIDWGRA